MSAKEVLQNIHHFLGTVLPDAYFSGNWDLDLLNYAFQWAEYCEKVYESMADQPEASKLDAQVRAIGSAIEHDGPSPVNLEYLKSSSKILIKAFMQNRFIEKNIYEAVLKKAEDQGCLEEALEDTAEIKAVSMALIGILTYGKLPNSVESLSQMTEAELHMDHIVESIIQCSSCEETEHLVSSYLDSSFSDTSKMREFLYLTLKTTAHDSSSIQKLQEIFTNELLKRINKADEMYQSCVASHVWDQEPSLLSSLSAKSFCFFKCYINFLVESACAMKANYEDASVTWEASATDLETHLTFSNAVLHFKCLLSADQKVCSATKTLLLSLASNPEGSPVWRDICCCLGIF